MLARHILTNPPPIAVRVEVVLDGDLFLGLYNSKGSEGCDMVLVPAARVLSASRAIDPLVCPSDVISLVSTHVSRRRTPVVSLSFSHSKCVMNDFSAGGLSCAVASVDTKL